jgi:hypothetical protein
MRHLLIVALVFASAAALAQSPTEKRPGDNPIPDTFTNLQVLPKDISKRDLVNVMKDFCMTMKVRCSNCHTVSDDLTEGSFSSDDKETKVAARNLIRAILATQHDLKPAPKS